MPSRRLDRATPGAIPDTGRYAFLRALKLHDDVSVVCRLPECTVVVKRVRGQGPTRWFHEPACAKKFRQRRQALDELIERLSVRLTEGRLTWRERTALEWEVRWLIGVRSAYVGPTDWLNVQSDDAAQSGPEDLSSPTAARPLDALTRAWRAQPKRRPQEDQCFVCDGTGTRESLRAIAVEEGLPQRAEAEAFQAGFWSFFRERGFRSVDECFQIAGETTARHLARLQAGDEPDLSVLARLRPTVNRPTEP